jgi:hypothetical protein
MRLHFFTRLSLLLAAGFLVVASQVWTGATLQWLFIAGGIVMIIGAAMDGIRASAPARLLAGAIAVLGIWTIIESFVFDGANLEWWSFASACALALLSTAGLVLHEMSTERVVHELSVTRTERRPTPSAT